MEAHSRYLRYLWLALALAPLPASGGELIRVYVTHAAGDDIRVIDPVTNKVVQEIKGVEAAHGIAPAPDGSRVYVSNEADSTLDVFDRESGALRPAGVDGVAQDLRGSEVDFDNAGGLQHDQAQRRGRRLHQAD